MILIVFGSALLLGVILFFFIPPRRAAIACLIGGWCLLPTADFVIPDYNDPQIAQADAFAAALKTGIGSALLSPGWITRSTVIGMAVLMGMILADFKSLRRLKPQWFDVPIVIWCIAPLFSGLINELTIEASLLNTAYHLLAWGSPYLAGRLYFSDLKPLRELGIALVIAGLIYAPLCIIETVFGPVFYEFLYQYHPYRLDGLERYRGFRPMILLEHGNQLGIWMSSIAMLAFWMHMCGALPRYLLKCIPSHVAVLILIIASLFTQSLGGIALMVLGIITFAMLKQGMKIPKPVWIGALVCVLGLGAFAVGGDKVVGKVIGQGTVDKLKNVSRLRSLGWRVNTMREGLKPVMEQPFAGLGHWDWWTTQEEVDGPIWSLFAQGFAQHGILAAMALLAVFAFPIWQFIDGCPMKLWTDINLGPPAALVMFLMIHAIDGMLNPSFSTSLVCIAGGLNTIGPYLKRALKSA